MGQMQHSLIRFASTHTNDVLQIKGYHWMSDYHYFKDGESLKRVNSDRNISIIFKDNSLYMRDSNINLINMNLNSLVSLLKKECNSTIHYSYRDILSDNMEYIYKSKEVKVKLLVDNIAILDDGNISSLNCKILWKNNTSSKN